MRPCLPSLGLFVIGMLCTVFAHAATEKRHRHFGPSICPGACDLNRLDPFSGKSDGEVIAWHLIGDLAQRYSMVPGDDVTLCNETYCSTYVKTDSDGFYRTGIQPRISGDDDSGAPAAGR